MAAQPSLPLEKTQGELFPLDVVRVETVVSRNPIHNLSRQGKIDIAINQVDDSGKTAFKWQVSHNSRYGPPGPLAYKLDTLIVNRRIEEAGRPVPKVIRLGSLREICAELDISDGQSKEHVKRALLQNASAFITAKLDYKGQDGSAYTFEFSDTRYGVVLTGQKFPDGRRASAVYLILHDLYRGLLDQAPMRPLDYDYLKALTPGAQRFYELVSYQIYAAIRHNRPDARYRYSDYCTFAPQARYLDWEHVRKQMYKLHRPHLEAGYLAQVEPEETTTSEGEPDWWFRYTPGPKAIDEYNSFAARRLPRRQARHSRRTPTRPTLEESLAAGSGLSTPAVSARSEPAAAPVAAPNTPPPELVERLVANELNRSDAERFARDKPEECLRQLDYLASMTEFKTSRGAYLRTAIEQSFGPPKGYAAAKAKRDAVQRQQTAASQKQARQSHEKAHRGAYLAWVGERVGELERAHPEVTTGFRAAEEKQLQTYHRTLPAGSAMLQAVLTDFERPERCAERMREFLQKQYPALKLPDFWAWDAEHNPEGFTVGAATGE